MWGKLRRWVAALVIVLLTLSMLGVLRLSWLSRLQFVPALLGLSIGVLLFLFLLTWLTGRSYCSFLCPLGIWQDIVSRLFRRGCMRRYRRLPQWVMLLSRYLFLSLAVIAYFLHWNIVVSILDPHTAYARIVHQFVRPLWIPIHNFLASHNSITGWWMHHQECLIQSQIISLLAIGTLFVLTLMVWAWGRAWCNAVCPVGTILGWISRFSLFGIRIDFERCTSCHKCASQCKTGCINVAQGRVDTSRCVVCLNCLESCPNGAVGYGLRWRKPPIKRSASDIDHSRRHFLFSSLTFAVAAPLAKAQDIVYETTQGKRWEKKIRTFMPDGRVAAERFWAIMPPATISRERFHNHCTSCQLCVVHCPEHILRPATATEYGPEGLMQPTVSFEQGWCRPECNVCAEVCPTGAIRLLDIAEKRRDKLGFANFNSRTCVTQVDRVACDACVRHCPHKAIEMIEKEGFKVPRINVQHCTGCGACEHYCPASPKAIYVEGLLY